MTRIRQRQEDFIFLDHHATTPIDQRVLDKMLPYFTEHFGNDGSKHELGRFVRKGCQQARQHVATLINASPEEVIFTSGATESNNLAIKGLVEGKKNEGRHIITCATEHKAVLDTCRYLERQGFEVTYLPVDQFGLVDPEEVRAAIRLGRVGTKDRTILITLMGANNEIGTVHCTAEIGSIARELSIVFHVDGAQLVGKLPVDVSKLSADMISLSGHKMYGPKGIGALYVRKSNDWSLVPQIHGGGQEFGCRSGTLPVALVIGFGEACRVSLDLMEAENQKSLHLRERLWKGLQAEVGDVRLNGHPTRRLPGNLNVTFDGIDSELLQLAFKKVAISSSSACSADSAVSHVLTAIGRSKDEALCSVRFGIGRHNTDAEIDEVIERIARVKARFGRSCQVEKRPSRLTSSTAAAAKEKSIA